MGGARFDALTKQLARGVSRRRLVTATGGLFGASLASSGPAAAFICRQPGVLCAKDAQCCSGSCVAFHCCAPEPAATTCAGRCGTVTNNCGQPVDCTALCAGCCSGDVCAGGTSDSACGANGATCVACQPGQSCTSEGACRFPFQGSCQTGEDFCAGNDSGGCNGRSDCDCGTTAEGATACYVVAFTSCGGCTTSADCGTGEVCVQATGESCPHCDVGQSFCQPTC